MTDDFDILIGATAVFNGMVMETNNVVHLSRLNNIVIEDWTARTRRYYYTAGGFGYIILRFAFCIFELGENHASRP